MAKPQEVYRREIQARKTVLLAKNAKELAATVKADQRLAAALNLLRRRRLDERRLDEISKLCEAAKKGELGDDKKKKALIEGIKELIDLAKHADELAHADGTLLKPAKDVIGSASRLSGPAPNFIGLLPPFLIFIMVLRKLLKRKPVGK